MTKIPLPAPTQFHAESGKWNYTADQMREYGRQCAEVARLEERAECAKVCDAMGRLSERDDGPTFYTATGRCAAAIRARGGKA